MLSYIIFKICLELSSLVSEVVDLYLPYLSKIVHRSKQSHFFGATHFYLFIQYFVYKIQTLGSAEKS